MIFRRKSEEVTFVLDDKTIVKCVAKNIEEAKRIVTEKFPDKKFNLVARQSVFGRVRRGTIAIVRR